LAQPEDENSGKPEDSSQAKLEERRFGATRRFTKGAAERMRDSRRLEDPSPVQPEDAGAGETRSLIAGETGGARMRGNPETRPKGTPKGMRDSRQLEDPPPAQPEDAGCGETRNLIEWLKRTMIVQATCGETVIETPETSVPGVFVCA
jgi:hypothetical protein